MIFSLVSFILFSPLPFCLWLLSILCFYRITCKAYKSAFSSDAFPSIFCFVFLPCASLSFRFALFVSFLLFIVRCIGFGFMLRWVNDRLHLDFRVYLLMLLGRLLLLVPLLLLLLLLFPDALKGYFIGMHCSRRNFAFNKNNNNKISVRIYFQKESLIHLRQTQMFAFNENRCIELWSFYIIIPSYFRIETCFCIPYGLMSIIFMLHIYG